jgi:hypothetical protein
VVIAGSKTEIQGTAAQWPAPGTALNHQASSELSQRFLNLIYSGTADESSESVAFERLRRGPAIFGENGLKCFL